MMIHASLFSGIGGFDLAAEWMEWQNAFHCEWNPFCQKILKHYWPNATSYEDITKTDFSLWRGRIDVLTGGFPCQPYSVAGKQLGTEDERHLWPEMLRAIREIKPAWVVGENVRGLVNWSGGLVFEQVQADLEAEGYEILPFLLPAAGVGAPHRRDRIWFIAYRSDTRNETVCEQKISTDRSESSSNSQMCNKQRDGLCTSSQKREIRGCNFLHGNEKWTTINTNDKRFEKYDIPRKSIKQNVHNWGNNEEPTCWQNFPTQSPVCYGDDGFSTESLRQYFREDSCGVISEKEIDKILSKSATEWRNESIKGGGNAIVPQVALQIFQAIQQYTQDNA